MKKFFIYFFLIFLSTNFASQAAVTASVEKKVFAKKEPIVLTIKATDNVSAMPDLSVLKNLFNVLSTSVSKQSYIINGQKSAETTWTFILSTNDLGKITIPEIVVGNEKTNALFVTVSDEETEDSEDSSFSETPKNLYTLEGEIKGKKEPFVQEQINYIVRLRDKGELQNILIDFETTTDFIIKSLQEPVIKTAKDGLREIVFSYALFAQKSGELKIPNVYLNASIYQKPNVKSIFGDGLFQINIPSFFGLEQPIKVEKEGEKINILPVPENYQESWWLPAQKVEISARFVDLPYRVVQGSVLTREITLKAVGLNDSQLPELNISSNEDVTQYPEKPTGRTEVSDGKIIGIQKTLDSFIIQKSGEVTLPEIVVPWFNVNTQSKEEAVLKSEKIKVYENSVQNKTEQSGVKEKETSQTTYLQNGFWLLLQIMIAFLGGVFAAYFMLKPKKKKTPELRDVASAAKKKDLRALRDNLILWAQKNYPDLSVSNLKDVAGILGDNDFDLAVDSLVRALYGQKDEKPFDEKYFQKAFKKAIKNKKKKKEKEETPLPPLYQ